MGKFLKGQIGCYGILAALAGGAVALGGISGTITAMLIFPFGVALFCLLTALYGIRGGRVSLFSAVFNGAMLTLGGLLTAPFNDQGLFSSLLAWGMILGLWCSLLPRWCAQRARSPRGKGPGRSLWKAAAALSLALGVYGLAAWLSTLPGSSLPKGLFYDDSAIEDFLEPRQDGSQWILWDQRSQEPFTGTARIFAPRLRLNPLPRRVIGLSCFKDGLSLGQSLAPWRIRRTGYSISAGGDSLAPPLLHRHYRDTVEQHLQNWGAYWAFQSTSGQGRRSVTVIFMDPQGRINRWRVAYHRRSPLVSRIFPGRLDPQRGWIHWEPQAAFDGLGFPLVDLLRKGRALTWRASDFQEQTLEDLVWQGRRPDQEARELFLEPKEPSLLPRYSAWSQDQSVLENLCRAASLQGSPQDLEIEVLTGDRRRRLREEERRLLGESLSAASLRTALLDRTPWASELFPSRFEIRDSQGATLRLYWRDGEFFCDDGVYVFSLKNQDQSGFRGQIEALLQGEGAH